MQSDIMLLINGVLFQEQSCSTMWMSILFSKNTIPGAVLHWVCPNQ